jgi:hypothetical protein
MTSTKMDFRGLVANRLFQAGLVLTFGALASIVILFIALRFRWIDVIELGLSRGIDGIGRALAPLHLVIYGSTSLFAVGVAILIATFIKANFGGSM